MIDKEKWDIGDGFAYGVARRGDQYIFEYYDNKGNRDQWEFIPEGVGVKFLHLSKRVKEIKDIAYKASLMSNRADHTKGLLDIIDLLEGK